MKLTSVQERAISEIKQWIDQNPGRRLEVSKLIPKSGLSESKFTKGFRSLYGITVYQYELKVSMEYAGVLLKKGISIRDIASMLGYNTSWSFSRAFSHIYHQTPTKFRVS